MNATIYADFNNADTDGRLRLNNEGTKEDLERTGLNLSDGMRIVLHDEECEADGVVSYSASEKIWVAAIDWQAIRHLAA